MEKKLTKNEKGITLVALIITIIILLILAVISIRAITGDNILGKSETAKEKYTNAKNNELDTLKDYENNIGAKKLDIQKVIGKAYSIDFGNNQVIVYSIIKNENEKIKIKAQLIGNSQIQATEVTDISYEFDPITVFLDGKKEEINSKEFIKVTIENEEGTCLYYISENYMLQDCINNKEYHSGSATSPLIVRNKNYDNNV